MKLFSNFDTWLCEVQYSQACEEYGTDKALFIRRDRFYLILKVYQPIIRWVIWSIVLLVTAYRYAWPISVAIAWIIVAVVWIPLCYFAFDKRVDWWMDYTIITPRQVIQYDQTWLLSRSTRTLDLAKVKSINIKKNGLITSIFNLWDIVFFSEWDDAYGDIRLNYIKKPIALKQAITKIMHDAISARQSNNQESWEYQ